MTKATGPHRGCLQFTEIYAPHAAVDRSGKLLLIILGILVVVAVAIAAYFTASGSATPNSTTKGLLDQVSPRVGVAQARDIGVHRHSEPVATTGRLSGARRAVLSRS